MGAKAMRTQVEFRSNKFPSYETDIEGVNVSAGVFGKRLADYLAEKLPAHGVVVGVTAAEDWGWMVEIKHDGDFPLMIGCASTEDEGAFRCFIEPSKPVIRRWFKKIDARPAIEAVSSALQEILRADPDISDVEWLDAAGGQTIQGA
jgi:hypothetical protein